jgi:hypothetical protein
MPAKKKTDDLNLTMTAEENTELFRGEEQTEENGGDAPFDSSEDKLEDAGELPEFENEDEENDVSGSEKQIETSEVDINDLLGSMDADIEDGGEATEAAEIAEFNEFNAITEDGEIGEIMEQDNPDEPNQIKTRRASRAKKESEPESGNDSQNSDSGAGDSPPVQPARRTVRRTAAPAILTIDSKAEVETQESIEETAWHEVRNAYRTRKILTGSLDGLEQTETGKTIVIVNYNDFRVVIPMKEMMLNFGRSPTGQEYTDLMLRQNKILGTMLGAEIDFIVKGIETKTRSIVASRQDAMLKKRQIFYMNTDASGMYRIYDGRIVQARVIAVAEKVVRIEAFGVECSILARDLSWDWLGDAHERFNVGDQILVRILSVQRNSLEDISIRADIKSVSDNTSHENLKKCRVQSKYAGKVTDVHGGVVYIRLSNGANAIAHSCYDRKMPGKKDDVSFAVTHIDEEHGVAMGLITRIIKQNL